jgi:general secretion pathway protein F
MPAFEYKALKATGREERGVVEGDTPRQVRQVLRERGLTPLDVAEVAEKREQRARRMPFLAPGISASDLALLTRQLATLGHSGATLEEALGTAARQTEKRRVQSVILAVRARVVEGHSLAAGLSDFPAAFPELYRATVAAGEQSGHLDAVLERLADYTEARQEMKQKIMMALLYPVILTALAILVVIGLLAYVVPQVVQVFEGLGQELPLLTRSLIVSSDAIRDYGLFVGAGLIALVIGFMRLLRNEDYRERYHRFVLRLPIVGKLNRSLNTARFARTLSILAASGVPILEALRIAGQVVSNVPMRRAIESAGARVREGTSIKASLERSGLFPPMTLYLIASGESSGKLEDMLERAAVQQERESSTTIAATLGLFEPLLILVMGGVVLVIVLAILLPILEINQLIQ